MQNEERLTEVPEQVSFQELSTVLCAGARKRWKNPQHIRTIHQGLEGSQGQGVSLRQIQDIPDFSNAVIVDCVFSSACLLSCLQLGSMSLASATGSCILATLPSGKTKSLPFPT